MTAITFLTRRVYRRSTEVPGIAALILVATRRARNARSPYLTPSQKAFEQTQEASALLSAASLGLRDQGISTETLLRVAAEMAERCAQGVDVAELVEAGQ